MSYTRGARVLADLEELAATAALGAGRCAAAGLDPDVYRGWVGAAVALGSRPRRLHRSWAWRTDREMLIGLADLEDDLTGRWGHLKTVAAQVAGRREYLLESRAPTEHVRAAIEDCNTAIAIAEAARRRLEYAHNRLRAVPEDLGDTYEALYRMVRSGRAMPHDGRWLTGTVARS